MAQKYGIINRAIPEEEIDSFVSTLANRMAALLSGVIDAAKNAVNATFQNTNGIITESAMLCKVLAKPAAAARMITSTEKSAQTNEGECQLKKILNKI